MTYDVESLLPHDIEWGYAPLLLFGRRADRWVWLQGTARDGRVTPEFVAALVRRRERSVTSRGRWKGRWPGSVRRGGTTRAPGRG